jgi:hypothetical protein
MVMRCSWIHVNIHGNVITKQDEIWILDDEPCLKSASTYGTLCVSISNLSGELLISIKSN